VSHFNSFTKFTNLTRTRTRTCLVRPFFPRYLI
jgi:hypothetical protein